MPAFSTHYIFASEMIPYLEKTADCKINKDAVYFGTQGPDIFFFHRALPWMIGKPLRKYGSMIHRAKPEVLFENMRKYCRISKKPDIAKSYVYGFILHYALDRNCHPYVYYLQNKITKENRFANHHSVHNTIEFSMDLYLMNKRAGIENPRKFNTASTVSDDTEVIEEIGRLLEYVVPRTIDKNLSFEQAILTLRDTKYIQNILFDPKGYKHIFLSILETILAPIINNYKFTAMMLPKDLEKAKKYANIDNDKWVSPYSHGDRYESFENLFDYSKKDAGRMIKAFQSGKDCEEITENKSFLTGVEAE